jgi:hypothetical protein
MLTAFLAIQAALLFARADPKPITDAQLVGSWQPSAKTYHPPHGINTITYHADHTIADKGYTNEGPSVAHGTWQLSGRKLVTRFGDILVREIVLTVSARQFTTRAPDGTIWTYTRVKQEQ